MSRVNKKRKERKDDEKVSSCSKLQEYAWICVGWFDAADFEHFHVPINESTRKLITQLEKNGCVNDETRTLFSNPDEIEEDSSPEEAAKSNSNKKAKKETSENWYQYKVEEGDVIRCFKVGKRFEVNLEY